MSTPSNPAVVLRLLVDALQAEEAAYLAAADAIASLWPAAGALPEVHVWEAARNRVFAEVLRAVADLEREHCKATAVN